MLNACADQQSQIFKGRPLLMAKNRRSATNPRGLSDAEIVTESLALAVVCEMKDVLRKVGEEKPLYPWEPPIVYTELELIEKTEDKQKKKKKLLGWVASRADVREAVIAYTALDHWDSSMIAALDESKRVCGAMHGQLAAAAILREFEVDALKSSQNKTEANE